MKWDGSVAVNNRGLFTDSRLFSLQLTSCASLPFLIKTNLSIQNLSNLHGVLTGRSAITQLHMACIKTCCVIHNQMAGS